MCVCVGGPGLNLRQRENGLDESRVRALIVRACRCHRGKCFESLRGDVNDVMAFMKSFWSLEKPSQDAYVIA